MKFRFLGAALVCAAAILSATSASAGYITSNGTVDIAAFPTLNNSGANPPLTEVLHMSLVDGQLFTNQVGGVPFTVGSTIRTVGIARLGTAFDGTSAFANSSLLRGFNGNPLTSGNLTYAVFAVEGTIESSFPGAPTAKFTAGSVMFTTAPGTFFSGSSIEVTDPLDWNLGSVFATYDLAPVGSILPGSLFGLSPAGNFGPIAASSVNRSQAVVSQTQGDGAFVFQERTPGDTFISNVETSSGAFTDVDFLAVSTSQLVQADVVPLNAAQILALNAIGAAAGFGGAFDEGGYTPSAGGLGTGDFNAGLQGGIFVATPVPEPASLAVFAIASAFGAVGARRRRNRR